MENYTPESGVAVDFSAYMKKPIKVAFLVETTVQGITVSDAKVLFAADIAKVGDSYGQDDANRMHVDQVVCIKIQPAKDILGGDAEAEE